MLLLAAFCWRRLMFRTRFIVVTGSIGKTTTKELLATILRELPSSTVSTRGRANGTRHNARTLLRVRPWHRFAVLEAGTDRPGWMRRHAWLIGPDIAIILSVARTHTNAFATLDETAAEKATLLRGLRRNGVAILNADDPRVAAMAAGCRARVVRFSCASKADVRASHVFSQWPERLSLSISSGGITQRVTTQLVGKHWAYAVLGAVSAALQCGVSLEKAATLIPRVPPTPARMDPCILPSGAVMLRDDCNGSLDTFAAAFDELKLARAERKILVITSVSDSPETWGRRLKRIAADAATVVDLLVLVGKKPDTRKAASSGLAAGLTPDGLRRFEDLRSTATFLQNTLRSGDLVLLRGRSTDHLARLYHAQLREVSCWVSHCPKTIICDDCPELFATRAPVRRAARG